MGCTWEWVCLERVGGRLQWHPAHYTGPGNPGFELPHPLLRPPSSFCPPLQAFPLTSTPLSSPVYCLRFTTKHLYAALSYNLHVLDFQNP